MVEICKKCHRSLKQLMCLAMLMELGASVSPSPLDCEHDFEKVEGISETVKEVKK